MLVLNSNSYFGVNFWNVILKGLSGRDFTLHVLLQEVEEVCIFQLSKWNIRTQKCFAQFSCECI